MAAIASAMKNTSPSTVHFSKASFLGEGDKEPLPALIAGADSAEAMAPEVFCALPGTDLV